MATAPPVLLDDPPEYRDVETSGDSGARRRRLQYLRTILLYAVTLWAVVTLVFLLPRLIPGAPQGR
ncbi:MAG TPA: hypothetical protein VFK43_20875 [Acidimicrobiales bacterium]|nr:hypothetical protein [Acidimicrobiales bacterium]